MTLIDKVGIPRRTMVLFFVIDSSGSMAGAKIGQVNNGIREAIPAIRSTSEGNADAQIKIAVLDFSSGAAWITRNGPVEVENFNWTDINTNGTTDFGAACAALNEKLSTKAFMSEATGSFAPAIFLMSDGDPTDDWQGSLAALKQNGWFQRAIKVAIAIGDDANKDVLKEFTGSMEAVIEIRDGDWEKLKKMIKFVSVRASQVASKSSNVGSAGVDENQEKQKDLNDAIQELNQEDL